MNESGRVVLFEECGRLFLRCKKDEIKGQAKMKGMGGSERVGNENRE